MQWRDVLPVPQFAARGGTCYPFPNSQNEPNSASHVAALSPFRLAQRHHPRAKPPLTLLTVYLVKLIDLLGRASSHEHEGRSFRTAHAVSVLPVASDRRPVPNRDGKQMFQPSKHQYRTKWFLATTTPTRAHL